MKRIAGVFAITLLSLTTSAQWAKQKDVPAYNAAAPRKGSVKPILSSNALKGLGFEHPAQTKGYQAASRNSDLLYQLPCYCYCDRNAGHNSLRSCFEDEHGARCAVCLKEAIFADDMVKKKKTVKQIRAAINAGEHEKVDLNSIK